MGDLIIRVLADADVTLEGRVGTGKPDGHTEAPGVWNDRGD